MRKVTKAVVFLMIAAMLVSVATACGSAAGSGSAATTAVSTTAAATTAAATTAAATQAYDKSAVLTWYMDSSNANADTTKKTLQMIKDKTGLDVQLNVLPGEGDDFYKKLDITLASGDATDLVNVDNPIMGLKYSSGGFLAPMNDIATGLNFDVAKEFGQYLDKDADGKFYSLPIDLSINAIFYNKKIFDDAGVPYPSGAWTWDQYVDTAKKLTNPSKGIYGSLMEQYGNYFYYLARQKNVNAYKPDGTSNLDDPAFADSMKWYADLGNVLKIQPSWLEMQTKKIPWNDFMNGKYGMISVGSWFLGLMTNQKDYPRDWKWGVAPIPVPADGTGKNTFGVATCIGINSKSAHQKEAFMAIKAQADDWAIEVQHTIPARVDLNDDQFNAALGAIVAQGDVTMDDLKNAFFPQGYGWTCEKILGPVANDIDNLYMQDGEAYCEGQKSLADTMKDLKDRTDTAIKALKN